METTKEHHGLLHQILPPRLEDAGLEECALPPESIHQAFLKAAAAVKSGTAAIFSDEDGAGCVSDPWSAATEESCDAVIGILPENERPGSCTVEKGCEGGGDEVNVVGGGVKEVGDDVVVGEGGVKLGEGEDPCVDELQGLGIGEDAKKKNGNGDEEKEKEPKLAEGFV